MDEPKTGAPPAPADTKPAHPNQDPPARDADRDPGDAHVTDESGDPAPIRPRTPHDDAGHPPAGTAEADHRPEPVPATAEQAPAQAVAAHLSAAEREDVLNALDTAADWTADDIDCDLCVTGTPCDMHKNDWVRVDRWRALAARLRSRGTAAGDGCGCAPVTGTVPTRPPLHERLATAVIDGELDSDQADLIPRVRGLPPLPRPFSVRMTLTVRLRVNANDDIQAMETAEAAIEATLVNADFHGQIDWSGYNPETTTARPLASATQTPTANTPDGPRQQDRPTAV